MELEAPVFFNTDKDQILSEMTAYYEDLVGFKLSPGQAETLIINAFAYREQIIRIQGNEAAKQNLLAYARYPMIDYLGGLIGVQRLPANKATCDIIFTLVEGHGTVVLPAGIRVQSIDGKTVFETLEEKTANNLATSITVQAQCTTDGELGNDYAIGEISIILDPQAYVAIASNVQVTGGGADAENDEGLRERIRLAPSSFSCAGPRGAYEYFAKSAHPSIIDVGITSPTPGQVNIYPLIEGAETPDTEIIDAVFAKVNDDKVRPLTDTVVVEAPGKIDYAIEVDLTLLTGTLAGPALQRVTDNLQAYADARKRKLGTDAVISQIIGKSSIDGVYDVTVVSPLLDVEVDFSQVAFCTDITVNISGYSDE